MEKTRFNFALLYPFLAVIIIAAYAGGLGVLFVVLNEVVMEEWSVVVLGMALVVGVPVVAALVQRRLERE